MPIETTSFPSTRGTDSAVVDESNCTQPKKRVAFIYRSLSHFIETDIQILSRHFEVLPLRYANLTSLGNIIKAVFSSDIVYCWFAGRYAVFALFFARLFGKKGVVVVGGYDVINDNRPELPLPVYQKVLTRLALEFADHVLAISDASLSSARALIPARLWTKMTRVYLGVAFPEDQIGQVTKKEKMALTVSRLAKDQIERKGLLTFVRAAHRLPNIPFTVVGAFNEHDPAFRGLKDTAPGNVTFTGYIERSMLYQLYQRAKVYVQVSRHEGFGLALAEAMAHGCIPIASERGAIPEVVGQAGIYVDPDDDVALAEAIESVVMSDEYDSLGVEASQRVLRRFNLLNREQELLKLLGGMTAAVAPTLDSVSE